MKPGTCNVQTFLRPKVKPGLYMAWAMADNGCAITEASEVNNDKAISYLVKAVPDVGVDSASPKPEAGPPDVGPEQGVKDVGQGIKDVGTDVAVDAGLKPPDSTSAPDSLAGKDAGQVTGPGGGGGWCSVVQGGDGQWPGALPVLLLLGLLAWRRRRSN